MPSDFSSLPARHLARIGLLFLAILLTATPVLAEEDHPDRAPTEMETVTVTGQAEDQLSGSSTLAGEVLQQLPLKNGSIAEAITVLPHVQAGEGQRTSEQGGEILPPLISISGARPYENYYSVDGVGLNSLLDPLADSPSALDSVPGHPQRTFIQRDLIDSVTVYDSNIPARYGRFLGGVVDARTRMPASVFGASLSYRSTRDEWARQHIDPAQEADFESSRDHTLQPDYDKYEGSLSVDLPLDSSSGVLLAYSRINSEIALNHIGQSQQQERTLENYLVKYAWAPASPWSGELTGTYTPSEESYFLKNTRDSDLEIDRGGYSVNGLLTGHLATGDLQFSAAYMSAENSRTAPNNFLAWQNSPSKNWGQSLGINRSQEGGFGDLDTEENSLQLKIDFTMKPVQLGGLNHTVSLGAAITRDEGSYDRKESAYVYNTSVVKPAAAKLPWLICAPEDNACLNNEQYFSFRNVYAAGETSAVVHHRGYYAEDLVRIGRVTLRPGLRLSKDDYLDNLDMAHRFTGDWDFFGDDTTRFLVGHNRYYGEALLTYSLREAITPYARETRTLNATSKTLSDWAPSSISTATLYKNAELDTPFSDEFTAGVKQQLLGGILSLNYLDRHHRDQFARETITEGAQKYYVLNNNGESNYESWSAGWERQWPKHYVNINYTYTESESSNESYDATLDDTLLDEEVWYDGEYTTRDELPRIDYYRPHVVNVIYVGKLPYGFTFTNVTKYQSGYEALESLSKDEKLARNIPTSVTAYKKGKRSGSTIFDWRLDWETKTYRDQLLIVSLEINNVFDRKVHTGGTDDDVYELGREFWLGMTYRF